MLQSCFESSAGRTTRPLAGVSKSPVGIAGTNYAYDIEVLKAKKEAPPYLNLRLLRRAPSSSAAAVEDRADGADARSDVVEVNLECE